MQSLIAYMGGPATAEQRLDTMFIPDLRPAESDGGNGIGTTIFNPGNEPSFQTPFLYHYFARGAGDTVDPPGAATNGTGRSFKSVQRGRETVNTYYSAGASGLPGNSDAGAVDSWLIWNFLGLYPVVTQDVYLVLAPWFSDVTLGVGEGKTLRITANGLGECLCCGVLTL